MPKFKFVALDSQGRESEGVLDAESQARAIAVIKERGYFPTKVDEVGGNVVRAERKTTGAQKEINLPPFVTDLLAGKVKAKQLMVITRQLATLLDAGVPLLRGLQIMLKQEKHPTMRKTLSVCGESIEGGSTLAEALAQHPKVFEGFYVNMVRAGEAGGVLEEVLNRLAEFMEKSERLKTKIRGAMVYPIVVLIIAVCILVFMIVKIIPKFAEIFTSMLGSGSKLPLLTRFVIGLSDLAIHQGPLIILGIILFVVGMKVILKFDKGRYIMDVLKLRLPIVGNLVRLTSVAHFARTLSTLLSSGVPILQALTIVSATTGNAVISNAVNLVHDSVKEGESISGPMEESGVFPLMSVSMVEVGEETGALPEMLTKVADTYEYEVDSAVDAMTSIIEPIMIVMLALVVGVIVIAMFMPLVGLISQMSA